MTIEHEVKRSDNVVADVVELDVANIAANPAQPRVIFDDFELSQLAISIRQNGILQPLTVRKADVCGRYGVFGASSAKPRYELIAGERRLRAAKMAGLSCVPCIVMERTAKESALLAVLENIQRTDLNYIEEAYAIKRLIEGLSITQEEAAVKLGMAQSTVANKLRLLKLSDNEKALVLKHGLNERQARSLLRLPAEYRTKAIERICTGGLNTVQADKLVEELLAPKAVVPQTPERQRKAFYIKHTSLYINTFNHTIDTMKKAGIPCEAQQRKTDEFVEYVIKIPLK
jgi:ParB family chromosome partitioning protein